MSQNRDAPAYQEYAATMLAQIPFRTMTLQDRGLLYTLRMECWVNVRLPHNHNDLAKVLGLTVADVAASLAAVMPFFEVVDGFIVSPEMENYRAYLADRKNKQSHGGKRGSAITNGKRNRPAKAVDDGVASTPSSTSRLPRQGGGESLVKPSTEKPSQNQPPGRGVVTDPFIAEYEAAERCTADAYAKASGGGYPRVTAFVLAWRKSGEGVTAKSAFVPPKFQPGEAFQFDWSEESLVIGGVLRKVIASHTKLCASRAFAALGGVPKRGIYDNMKTAVDKISKGNGRIVNTRFYAMTAH